jgi:AraC-like DNA-binding protein
MSADVVRSALFFARALGVELEALEHATGLAPAEWLEPEARLPDDTAAAVWTLLRARFPGRALALEMAAVAPYAWFGNRAHGAQYAPDLRTALATLVRYRAVLSSALELTLRESGDAAVLAFHHPSDALDGGAGAEAGLALGHRFLSEVVGARDAVMSVQFAHAATASESAYTDFFEVPVRFGASVNALSLRADAMGRPLRNADPDLFAHIRAQLDRAHGRIAAPDPLAEVRDAIADGAARGEYDTATLARRMGLSLRVLQRQVAAQSTTLRSLLDEARKANAQAFLADERLSVEQVAHLLAYTDERAFRRAFTRLAGTTPARWRRARRQVR